MARKASLLLAAIALGALAIPQFASANAKVTDPPGVLLAKGAKITVTSIGTVSTLTSLGNVSCPTADFTGELTANTGTTYRGIGIGAGTTATCKLGPLTVIWTDLTVKEIHSATTLKGTINLTFNSDYFGVTCHFESPNMPYTVTATDTIKVTNGDLQGTPAACEPGVFNGTFTIETDLAPFTQIHLD